MNDFWIDFTFTDWKLQKGYSQMEEFSIAKLEEELGLYGYLHNATSMCNRTAGMFAGSTDGWKNGNRRRFINKHILTAFHESYD